MGALKIVGWMLMTAVFIGAALVILAGVASLQNGIDTKIANAVSLEERR